VAGRKTQMPPRSRAEPYQDYFLLLTRLQEQARGKSPAALHPYEAAMLFSEIKDLKSFRPGYDDNGCLERAELVQHLLLALKAEQGIIFFNLDPPHKWDAHSAAFIWTQENGIQAPFVLDPALPEALNMEDYRKHWIAHGADPRSFIEDHLVLRRAPRALLDKLWSWGTPSHQDTPDFSP
jgi:hypothetical protein